MDPNIFDKPYKMLRGLARLVVLDKLRSPEERLAYHERQRAKKKQTPRHHFKTDTRTLLRMESAGAIDAASDYSTVFLPWGPDFTAVQTLKMMKKKDRLLNGRWFAKDREYNIHPCFFGTAKE